MRESSCMIKKAKSISDGKVVHVPKNRLDERNVRIFNHVLMFLEKINVFCK